MGRAAFIDLRLSELSFTSEMFGINLKISQTINVGILDAGDGKGAISMVLSHHISASAAVDKRSPS